MAKYCPKCGRANVNRKTCPYCGTIIPASTIEEECAMWLTENAEKLKATKDYFEQFDFFLSNDGDEKYEKKDDLSDFEYTKNPDGTATITGLKNKEATSIKIPDSVVCIDSAFFECSNLKEVKFGKGLKSIGPYAFCGCDNLTSIDIPNGVTSIESHAFAGCKQLKSIFIPDGVTSIGNSAFSGYYSITNNSLSLISIPDSVTSIGKSAFSFCINLIGINIPKSVTSIGYEAFNGCKSLTSITIPNSITSIGSSVFNGCNSLEKIYFEMKCDFSDEKIKEILRLPSSCQIIRK